MVTLTGDQGFTQYKPSALAADVVATGATFHISQQTPTFPYPVDIRSTSGARVWTGGKWVADDISQTSDWSTEYGQGNAAGLRFENAPNWTVRNGHIDGTWDGIRFSGTNCNGFVVDGWLAENVRDDFTENDACCSGTIRDTLVDGALVSCMSTTNGSATTRDNKTVTITGSLFRSKFYLFEGAANEHNSPFKVNSAGINYNPRFVIHDSVFAVLRPDHNQSEPGGRLSVAFGGMTVTGESYWLNLSDTPFGTAYRNMIPAGFTVLQGAAARALWDQKRSAWRVAHGYDQPTTIPEPEPEPGGDMEPRVLALEMNTAALATQVNDLSAQVAALAAKISAASSALA